MNPKLMLVVLLADAMLLWAMVNAVTLVFGFGYFSFLYALLIEAVAYAAFLKFGR